MFARYFIPFAALCLMLTASVGAEPDAPKTNVLVIMADDLGFADLGCYGGDIRTPNLDYLAERGLRYTRFYNTGRCWTSRVSLLTGYYHDQMGEQDRPTWARTLPELLKPAGYRSYHSGKWHVDRWFPMPIADGGFDRSYYFADYGRYFWPSEHYLDDEQLPPVARGDDYYATTAKADYMIRFLKEHAEEHADKPFFAFLAFYAPHFPLHAPQRDIDRYQGEFADGWDARRARIFVRQKQMGLIETVLSPLERNILAPSGTADQRAQLGPGEVPYALRWFELNETQQRFQSMKMRIYAAMVDRMDQEIGRVITQIRTMGVYDNTLILFMSDNGASAEIMVRHDGHDPKADPGSGDSYLCLGPGWSTSSNTPFRRHKIWTHEGGIATPFIAHWPNGIVGSGEMRTEPGHLIDIAPTVLGLAGLEAKNPAENAPDMPGEDLLPTLSDDVDRWRRELYFNHAGNRAFQYRGWKVVSSRIDNSRWELHDLDTDRAEQNDLSADHPERLLEMVKKWERLNAQFKKDAAK
ncbi:MAG: arylsulfatase [Phycisphaeraceae bacterium]